jgi:5'-3' exonuclease
MSTLLVDGDNLLTIGIHGVKDYHYKGVHIGGIYHFLNTLNKAIETHHLDKICVFWDGDEGSINRKKLYPQYKENRANRFKSEDEIQSYEYQRNRVKQYLEEIYVRQGEYINCECDDCIAYYSQQAVNEDIIILSSDGDLTQLVSEHVRLYNPIKRKMFSPNDIYTYDHEDILIENVKIAKIMCGDPSDNIAGIQNLGIKRLITMYPEMRTQKISLDYIKQRGNEIFEENKTNKLIANLLTGVTKFGILGDGFFDINDSIVNLETPILTEEAKLGVLSLINDNLSTEGRSYKNTMKMMMQDGISTVLPKYDDAWLRFLTPFLKLTRKEKNKQINKYTR